MNNGELVRTLTCPDGKYEIRKYRLQHGDAYRATYFKKFGNKYISMLPMFEEADFMTKEFAEEYFGIKLD